MSAFHIGSGVFDGNTKIGFEEENVLPNVPVVLPVRSTGTSSFGGISMVKGGTKSTVR